MDYLMKVYLTHMSRNERVGSEAMRHELGEGSALLVVADATSPTACYLLGLCVKQSRVVVE